MVGTELSIEYAALESGLDRFVQMQKPDFVGREGLVTWQERGFENSFVTMRVDNVTDADAIGGNPLYLNGALVGRATSGGYGFRVRASLALAMVSTAHAQPGTKLEIDILGTRYEAEIIKESPFDPNNDRLRS